MHECALHLRHGHGCTCFCNLCDVLVISRAVNPPPGRKGNEFHAPGDTVSNLDGQVHSVISGYRAAAMSLSLAEGWLLWGVTSWDLGTPCVTLAWSPAISGLGSCPSERTVQKNMTDETLELQEWAFPDPTASCQLSRKMSTHTPISCVSPGAGPGAHLGALL